MCAWLYKAGHTLYFQSEVEHLNASYLPNFSWGHRAADDSACGDKASSDWSNIHILSVLISFWLTETNITNMPTSQAWVYKARPGLWVHHEARWGGHFPVFQSLPQSDGTGTKAANHKWRHFIKIWEGGENLKRDKIAKNKKQKSKTGRESERIERERRREKQKLKSLVFPKSKQIKILKENYFYSSNSKASLPIKYEARISFQTVKVSELTSCEPSVKKLKGDVPTKMRKQTDRKLSMRKKARHRWEFNGMQVSSILKSCNCQKLVAWICD